MPVLLFLGLLVGLLSLPHNPIFRDLDVGWLVKTGELILKTGRLPTGDIFSFAYPGHPWVLYQWGFEVYLGALHRLAGLGGVLWGTAILIALAYAFLFSFLLRLRLPRLAALGLTILTMLVNNFHWYSRPATLTVLAYTLMLLALESYRLHPRWQFWLLPFLFIIWANAHLGFVWGLAVVFIYGCWAFWAPEAFRGPGTSRDPWLLLIFPLCLAGALLNPYGPGLFPYLWHLSQATTMNAQIIELQSPNFHQVGGLIFLAQLVLIVLLSGPNYSGRPVILSVLAISLCLGLYSVRHLPFFSIPATLHLAYSLEARPGWQVAPPPPLPPRYLAVAGLGAVLALVWVMGVQFWRPGFYDFEDSRVPKGAASFLRSQADGSRPLRVFLWDCQWASYLIYSAYPQVQVFLDTRFDMYGEEAFRKFSRLGAEALENPEVLAPWKIDFLLLNRAQEASRFRPGAGWLLSHEDGRAVVYRPLAEGERKLPTADAPLSLTESSPTAINLVEKGYP